MTSSSLPAVGKRKFARISSDESDDDVDVDDDDDVPTVTPKRVFKRRQAARAVARKFRILCVALAEWAPESATFQALCTRIRASDKLVERAAELTASDMVYCTAGRLITKGIGVLYGSGSAHRRDVKRFQARARGGAVLEQFFSCSDFAECDFLDVVIKEAMKKVTKATVDQLLHRSAAEAESLNLE